jgi:hypothetical protein
MTRVLVERTFRFTSGGGERKLRGFSPNRCRRLKPARIDFKHDHAGLKARSTLGELR